MLEDRLDSTYYSAAMNLKAIGAELLPVRIEQVARLASLTEAPHIILICSTRKQSEYQAFARHVVPLLPMLLRQERLSFFHLSSFEKLNLASRISRRQGNFFLKYPLNLPSLCVKLKKFHQLKATHAQTWPGGRRAKVPGLSA